MGSMAPVVGEGASDQISMFNKYARNPNVLQVHTRCGFCGRAQDDPDSNYVYCGMAKWSASLGDAVLGEVSEDFDNTYLDTYIDLTKLPNPVSAASSVKKDVEAVVFDFDGVIHSYVSGWKGLTVIPDAPVPGIRKEIARIRNAGYQVIVVSTRCSSPSGLAAVENYLSENGIVVDRVTKEKPVAVLYIDDRAHCFTGDPTGLLEIIQDFEPWTKKLKARE